MKKLIVACLCGLMLALVSAPAQDAKKDEPKPTSTVKEVAVITTSAGVMVIEFWPDVAPKTVENFKTLAKKGFYDGTAFHRVMKGFMIQGGDPNTKNLDAENTYGGGGPGYNVKAEFNGRKHERGVISMARGNDPDSAGSQFFICDAPADNPGMQYLNGKYTAFGKLIKGEDVLRKIADTDVVMNPYGADPAPSKPVKRQTVESIKIVPADSIK